jgi:hypothetical protein
VLAAPHYLNSYAESPYFSRILAAGRPALGECPL